jgi:alkanesulfonate monooxygenase SsuD/methylene tetrahydromethanopterin reductase-like flavin-dependent oxidoreductase (luciferase family)
VAFDNIVFAHKPVQKPYPPIWVGGESGPALRRTARIGDAWYPIGTNPANPLDSLKRYQANVAKLRKMTEQAGRIPQSVDLVLRVTAHGESVPPKAGDGERRLFSGKPAEVAADMRAMQEMGVASLDFGFAGATVDAMLKEMERFRKEVLVLV